MKKFELVILLIVWMLLTLILTLSIVGLLVVALREDHNCENYQGETGESSWMKFGKKLLNNLLE